MKSKWVLRVSMRERRKSKWVLRVSMMDTCAVSVNGRDS
jgi:hypothetical protein